MWLYYRISVPCCKRPVEHRQTKHAACRQEGTPLFLENKIGIQKFVMSAIGKCVLLPWLTLEQGKGY